MHISQIMNELVVYNMKGILLAVFLTCIVSPFGIYYGKKNNETVSFYSAITILVMGIWYLLLRTVGKFLGYKYIYFILATFAYFLFVFLMFLIVRLCLYAYNKIHSNYLSKGHRNTKIEP
jgi:hypothetical protein